MTLKLKSMKNQATLDTTNSTLDIVIFNPKDVLGILDNHGLLLYQIILV